MFDFLNDVKEKEVFVVPKYMVRKIVRKVVIKKELNLETCDEVASCLEFD